MNYDLHVCYELLFPHNYIPPTGKDFLSTPTQGEGYWVGRMTFDRPSGLAWTVWTDAMQFALDVHARTSDLIELFPLRTM